MDECEILCRHLIGRAPPQPVRERFTRGSALLFADSNAPGTRALAFGLAHPWALGPLDAWAALLFRGSRVRRKLLFALALLETTPELAPWFEPRDLPLPAALFELAWLGSRAALNLAFGLLLWPFASPRR